MKKLLFLGFLLLAGCDLSDSDSSHADVDIKITCPHCGQEITLKTEIRIEPEQY